MGKHGPCYHCGVTSTPLWRNGPPEKPILCNACGSRWRTKGSLVNYTPLHSRPESQEYENYKIPRAKIMSIKHKEPNVLKRKQNHENKKSEGISHDCKHGSFKTVDEDMSNRSSSGSAVSNISQSCVQYGFVDTSKLTGPTQSVAWDQTIPSRKRTCLNRPKQSQLEKLTRDLHTILHEQQYSHFSISSEEDLLFDSDEPMVSVEIGHGSVLIRHPSSIAQEEESEASSISVENKICLVNDYYSRSPTSPLYANKVGLENNKRPLGIGMQQEQDNINRNCRDKDSHEKLMILENRNSPLFHVDLKEIINYEVFTNNMTIEEQQQLLQFLPELDKESLKKMFASSEFEEGIFSFQKLLSEGVFDLSFSGEKAEDCETLKTLAFSSYQKSTWVEQSSLLKEKEAKSCKKGFVMRERANVLAYGTSTNVKRSRDGHFRIGSGTKKTMKKSPSFVNLRENGGSSFTPGSLFSMVDKFQYMSENSQDLLIDVPVNNFFPEAELFYHNTSSSSVYPRLYQS